MRKRKKVLGKQREAVLPVKQCLFWLCMGMVGCVIYMRILFLSGQMTDRLEKLCEWSNSGIYERNHLQENNASYRILKFMALSVSSYAYVEENYKQYLNGELVEVEIIPLLSYMVGRNQKDGSADSGNTGENSIFGETYQETSEVNQEEEEDALESSREKIRNLYENPDYYTLIKNFYIVDSSTRAVKSLFDAEKLLTMDLHMEKKNKPQILIYHTHGASEAFADSREGVKEETVVGIGSYLAEILEEKYGYQVVHDETQYDLINGKIDRNKAYNQSLKGLKAWLSKYPSIEVVIDLHRDGVGQKVVRTAMVNGKKTAQVMFFNGLSRTRKGEIEYLHNDNLQANLAFSLQCKLAAMDTYPEFTKPVYLKSYRYNLHLKERSMLIELGNENNTLEEAKNAMEPLADVLNQVLSGEAGSCYTLN